MGDNNLKMTTFLTATSGLLKNPKRRMSQAIAGGTAEGKDNDIVTSLKHMPKNSFIFLTNATQSTIEDDIKSIRIIGFSEVNANREEGANKHLIEVIKQKTEGGTSSVKKDIRTGMKTARIEIGEQGTVLYATTEAEMDEEMQTRFIRGTIKTDVKRIKKVNENTLDTFSNIDELLKDSNVPDSWIRIGLSYYFNNKIQYEIHIPYAIFLKEQIGREDIFDNSDPRSQRDLKRVLSLTCAMTYIFQEQRKKIKYKGYNILISEPQDLINTLKFSKEFFNQTYFGLDERLNSIIKTMKKLSKENDWVGRDKIQEELGKSRNTIKEWCGILAGEGCIEGVKGKQLNEEAYQQGVNLDSYGKPKYVNIYNSNKIYYKRCQKGIKKVLIRCQLSKLQEFLESKTNKKLTPLIYTENNEFTHKKGIKKEGVNLQGDMNKNKNKNSEKEFTHKKNEKVFVPDKIDTFSLTPSPKTTKKEDFSEDFTEK